MSLQESREETYKRIKKRLEDYRYLSNFLRFGAVTFAVLFVLSLFPLVPAFIVVILGISMTDWSMWFWFLCIGAFAVLFWIFQRFAKKIEEKRGITLEELMYVPAYEALCHVREYLDPSHPIVRGKLKAERRVRDILTLLEEISFPVATLIREEITQLFQLGKNLRMRLLPSMKKYLSGSDSKIKGNVLSLLGALTDYLSKPELSSLVELNKNMMCLPEITERSIYESLRSTLVKRSILRHTLVFSIIGVVALLISYVDLNYIGASQQDAFNLGVTSFIALVTMYLTYLGLTMRREPRT